MAIKTKIAADLLLKTSIWTWMAALFFNHSYEKKNKFRLWIQFFPDLLPINVSFSPVYRAYLNSHKHLLYMQISANFYLIYCFRQATITVPFSQSIRLTSISLLGNQHLYRSNVDL